MNCLLCSKSVHPYHLASYLFKFIYQPTALCDLCLAQFEKLIVNCQRCGGGGQEVLQAICRDCLVWEEQGYLVNHQALFIYNQAMRDYFSSYKFNGDYRLRFAFAEYLSDHINKNYRGYLIVPIPVSNVRLEVRGFNQVIGLLEAASIKYTCLLSKPKEMMAQSSQNRVARLKISQPFEIISNLKADFKQKILVVDDIYTTGSTLYQAMKCLNQAGFQDISTFSLAR
ncbi:MAG: ComF family protein [Streptococcaceae bacterium]|jgi:competence protein ComFC|nr:ComF family protein [Streptococcaceae bacterium]MCH4177335.1 ComF family protein [Streptococcaceae bacterium]